MKINTKRIKTEMANQRLSCAELAEKSGLIRQSISTILKRGTCNYSTAGKVADALKIDVSEIMEDD